MRTHRYFRVSLRFVNGSCSGGGSTFPCNVNSSRLANDPPWMCPGTQSSASPPGLALLPQSPVSPRPAPPGWPPVRPRCSGCALCPHTVPLVPPSVVLIHQESSASPSTLVSLASAPRPL